jgi:hypothetical protein
MAGAKEKNTVRERRYIFALISGGDGPIKRPSGARKETIHSKGRIALALTLTIDETTNRVIKMLRARIFHLELQCAAREKIGRVYVYENVRAEGEGPSPSQLQQYSLNKSL